MLTVNTITGTINAVFKVSFDLAQTDNFAESIRFYRQKHQ